jgi:hypothetical protein
MPARKTVPAKTRPTPAAKAPPAPAKPTAAASPKAAPAPAAAPAKPKQKLVRDSFTMPKAEYSLIDALKQRAVQLGRAAKKSELLRAGIKALHAMNDKALQQAMADLPVIKTGRPKRSKEATAKTTPAAAA